MYLLLLLFIIYYKMKVYIWAVAQHFILLFFFLSFLIVLHILGSPLMHGKIII